MRRIILFYLRLRGSLETDVVNSFAPAWQGKTTALSRVEGRVARFRNLLILSALKCTRRGEFLNLRIDDLVS